MAMTLLTLLLIGTACDDKMDTPTANPSAAKQVEVSLHIGFANENDGVSLSNTRTNNTTAGKNIPTQQPAFDAQLISEPTTRTESVTPDKLYNLEIRQYDATTGTYIKSPNLIAQQSIGSKLTVNLTQSDNCQLVIVAWGTSIAKRLGTGSFSAACDVMIDQSAIKELPLTTEGMNKMPYYIHLPSVKVNADGTITNPDGTDVRLLLKRLATRVTLNWKYTFTNDYNLKEVRLEGVPTDYRAIPFINTKDNTYPSLLDQYTTIIVPASSISNEGSYSCWIPASLRGISNKATSAYYRNKENAPTGSVYATFIAQNKAEEKKKLNYRLYLGSNTSDNFDLNPNTNYNYQVNFAHQGLPTNDRRVSIIDPIPASEGNDFLSPTANCFMVTPGGAFCFDPFAYRQNGTDIENSTLKGWATDEGGIAYVKLLWQTKENGDLGDPVMGVVNSATDHSNIVEIKRIDGGSGAPSQKGQARIYCRVAPNTTGGSGAIAAFNAKNEILWSWHVWITDYKPDATGNNDVQTPENQRKQKYQRNGFNDQLPMMDRNLGAMAGYISVPKNELDRSKANGFHYQWGRKDPFRSSYSSKVIDFVTVQTINKPTEGILSLYKEDGITFFPMETTKASANYRTASMYPQNMYKTGLNNYVSWIDKKNSDEYSYSWGRTRDKGIYDPCPAGWRVCGYKDYYPLFNSNIYEPGSVNLKNSSSLADDRGILVAYNSSGNLYTYMNMTGYWVFGNQFGGIGTQCLIWCRDWKSSSIGNGAWHIRFDFKKSGINTTLSSLLNSTGWEQEALLVRCIQERE